MTAMVTTLIQPRPVGKELLQSTNIPFLDRDNPHAYSTTFREEFKPFLIERVKPFSKPAQAKVDHKDLRYIKEYSTEAKTSYQQHPLPQKTRTPSWTRYHTNFKMQTDPEEMGFLTTQAQTFQPQPFQRPPSLIRQTRANRKIQQMEKIPESTNRADFTAHHSSPVVRATVKHLEEGFPTIKGDKNHHGLVSQYKNTFQGTCGKAAQSVKKHTSSVAMGDPVKIVERETTHTASFDRPTVCSPSVVKERLKLNLGQSSQDSWSCTSREAFGFHKLGNPVVLRKINQNSSSLPRGDTDARRNRERMSVTTNRSSFSHLNHKERPVSLPETDLVTKSHVQFSPPRLSGLYYTTTANDHYSRPQGERARPAVQLSSNILRGPEHELPRSITKTDYVPLKTCTRTPCLSQHMTNFKFPVANQHVCTTHSEHYTTKPLITLRPACKQLFSHFVIR